MPTPYMKKPKSSRRYPARKKQAGAVSMIMVALAGIGVLGLTASGLQAIKASQDQQLTVHTNTQATVRAWGGVELMQAYFAGLDTAAVAALTPGPIQLTGAPDVSAVLVSNVDVSGVREITVNVTGRSADSTSTVQAVFQKSGGTGGSPGKKNHVTVDTVNINSNLILTGGINILGATSANIAVTGSVKMSGSVTGVNRLCATEDITLGSAIEIQRVCSLGSLTMTGGAKVIQDAEIVGDVNIGGGSRITTVNSNGNVTLQGGSAFASTVNTKGDVNLTGGNARIENPVNAEGNITWSSDASASTLNSNGNVTYAGANKPTTINARGNVRLEGNGNVQVLNAMGNVTLASYYGNGIRGSMRAGGNLTYQDSHFLKDSVVKGTLSRPKNTKSWELTQEITSNPSLVVNVPEVVVPVLNPEIKPSATVDVFQLKDTANYVFEPEGSKMKVTVRNVSGIDDGVYYIGSYAYEWDVPALARGNMDYLCKVVNSSGKCTEPSLPYRTICQGYSASNGCFSYNSSNKRWTINSQSIAPGVAWFDGDLRLGDGTFVNTFLATGNISTSGSLKVFSPNYAGYEPVCTNSRPSPIGVIVDYRLAGLYPTDLCVGSGYEPTSVGNVALMAGGFDASGTYVGGDISIGASNEIYGTVVAGNLLATSGSSKVVGAVQVANLRTTDTSASKATTWSGSTTIDLRNLPAAFSPVEVPCMTDQAGGGCSAPGVGSPGGVLIRWSRYI